MSKVPGRSTIERVLVGIAAAVFVFLPAGVFISGMRAQPLENRPLATPPSLNAGWGIFAAASLYTSDHLPIREAAIEVNQRIVNRIFREPPSIAALTSAGVDYPRVVVGQDDWLFYGVDFQLPCTPLEPVTATVARMSRLARVLRTSGRAVVITVVPDKSSIVTDRLPERYVGHACAAERKAAFWAAFTAARQPDFLDPRPALRLAQSRPGGAYLRSDSHWTPLGQVTYAQLLVDHLAPDVWDPSQVELSGTVTKAGDLGPMIQEKRLDTTPRYTVVRPGVTSGQGRLDWKNPPRLTNTATGSGVLIPGSTVVVGDSFTRSSVYAWSPWFAAATVYPRVPLMSEESPTLARAAILEAMTSSRTVILEVVERDAAQGTLGLIDDSFVTDLESALTPSPVDQ